MKMITFGVIMLAIWDAAEGDGMVDSSAAASGLGVHVASLLHERVGSETRAHIQLKSWCNTTIPAQENRRDALHHLLLQAQLSQSSEGAATKDALAIMKADIASLDEKIEKTRLTVIATQSLNAKETSLSNLDLDDASKDVETLQRTLDHMGGVNTPTNAAVKEVSALLAQAQENKHQYQKRLVLMQDRAAIRTDGNLSGMLSKYNSKKADIVAYQQQLFTTQRSLDVLTSALEDESEYLADLRSICSTESRVHQRLEKQMQQSMSQKSMKQSRTPVSSQPPKTVVAVRPDTERVTSKLHSQMTAHSLSKTTLAAMKVGTHVAKANTQSSLGKSTTELSVAKREAKHTVPVAHEEAPTAIHRTSAKLTTAPFVDGRKEAAAKHVVATSAIQTHTNPLTKVVDSTPKHPQSVQKLKDPFDDDDDDDDDEAVPPPAVKVASKASAMQHHPTQALTGTRQSIARQAASSPTIKRTLGDARKNSFRKSPMGNSRSEADDGAMDGDDDDDDDETVATPKRKLASKQDSSLRHTTKDRPQPVRPLVGKKMTFEDDDDEDDDSKIDIQHAEKPTVVKKSRSMVALQEGARADAQLARAQKQSSNVKVSVADNSHSADSFETNVESSDSKFDLADSEDDATSSTKEGAAVAAMKQELDVDEAIAEPSPDSSTSQAQLSKVYSSKPTEASPNALPTQYAAWSPSAKKTSSDQKRKAALAEMEAEFDDDDDAPKPAPRTTHHHVVNAPPSPPPPPPRKPTSDGVVYDDDDLPKHHAFVQRLEGGWEAFMKKGASAKPPSAKLDPDVAIMQSLYGKDGSLPSQYTAWSPDDVQKPSTPPQPILVEKKATAEQASEGETMDLEAAAKAFAKDPDSAFDFLQVAKESEDMIGDIILRAATSSLPVSMRGSAVLLEASESKIDLSRMSVASTVLAQYAEVLQSRPLKQLAKAKLSQPKLRALFQQLSNADPMSAKVSVRAQGKQAQAEEMCNYLQSHMQAAAPVHKAVSQMQLADTELGTALASQAAVEEEVDARTQLEKTIAQDVSSLKVLTGSIKQGGDGFQLRLIETGVTAATAANVGASFANIEGAHAEVQDLLDAALQKRTSVLQTQRQKLVQLQDLTKQINAEVAKKTKQASTSQAEMETTRKKMSGLSSSCGATLTALARRRHNGHMEAHAIEVALKVLGSQ